MKYRVETIWGGYEIGTNIEAESSAAAAIAFAKERDLPEGHHIIDIIDPVTKTYKVTVNKSYVLTQLSERSK